MSIGILYVEDHEVFHDCMRHFFDQQVDMQILGVANNGRSAVRLARELNPDIVLMDIMLPALNGIEATRQIVAENPRARVLGLSVAAEGKRVLEMFRAGAKGYVPKECAFSELLQAIRAVSSGRMYLSPNVTDLVIDDFLQAAPPAAPSGLDLLTPRERHVLQLVAEGKGSREIAEILNLGIKTVETHRANLMKKLRISNIAELVKFAVREGLTSL